jgi:outer membrane immunogenic protein
MALMTFVRSLSDKMGAPLFRKILISTAAVVVVSGSAFAADLPSRAPPPVFVPPPPIFTWSGFYIGGQVGYEWGRTSATVFETAGPASIGLGGFNSNGVVGGAHIGYNYQISQFVVGLEGDVNGAGYRGSNVFLGAASFTTRNDIDGSVRGRVGVAWDRALIYATGGAAFAPFRHTITVFGGGVDEESTTRVGWTIGGGIEYAITNNWSLRAEYRYTDYGHIEDVLFNSTGGTLAVRTHETDNRVQGGFSYKFDAPTPIAPPVLAKY